MDVYNQALYTSVDDMFALLEKEVQPHIGIAKTEAAKKALRDPTTTQGSRLASGVDALTLIAQSESSLIGAEELERAAARLLRRGLAMARNGRIHIEA